MSSEATIMNRKGLAPTGKITIFSLLTIVGAIVITSFVVGEGIDEFTIVLSAIMLVLAGIVATGWRWTPAVAATLSTLFLLLMIAFLGSALVHPQDPDFPMAVLLIVLPLVVVISGFAATVQNYRDGDRRLPSWLRNGLIALAGLVAGVLALSLIVEKPTQVRVTPETLEGLPTLRTEEFSFTRKEIRVKTGEMVALRLDNHDGAGHSFDIDELDVHVPMFRDQTALALFQPTEPGEYTFYCSIPGHANLEDGSGMIGTLIVEP